MHKNQSENFAPTKRRKMRKRARKSPKKAKPGAFWVLEGMGTVGDGSNQMRKPRVRTKTNPKTVQHMQKENRQKPRVSAGFVAGAEGLVSAAGSVGPGRSPQGCRPPRHAPQESLRAHLAAKSFCSLTKKSGTAAAIPDFFWQGQKDLNPRHAVLETAALPTELYPYLKFCLFILSSPRGIVNCFFEKRCNVFAFLTVHPHML